MDLVHVLKALSHERRWVIVGACVALLAACLAMFKISVLPPELTPRSSAIAAGSTEVLVDSQQTFLGDLRREIEPLTQRAGAYAHFVESQAVVDALSRTTKIPSQDIALHGPVSAPSEAAAPTSEQRANDLSQDAEPYRVQVNFNGELPILSIFTQAPTVDGARVLANGMATALRTVVADIQEHSDKGVNRVDSVQIRQLGVAKAGMVSESASYVLGVLAFIGVFGASCIFILVARNFGVAWRKSDEEIGGLDPDRVAAHRAVHGQAPDHPPVGLTANDGGDGLPWEEDVRHQHATDY